MTNEQTKQMMEQIENLTIAVQELVDVVQNLSHHLKGDGGHTVGDSLEGIMTMMYNKEKKGS